MIIITIIIIRRKIKRRTFQHKLYLRIDLGFPCKACFSAKFLPYAFNIVFFMMELQNSMNTVGQVFLCNF